MHIGHMALANYMLSFTDLNQVWFVVSPQNPLKEKSTLLNQNQRLEMLELAINQHPKMRVSNIEFSLPIPSYTINTLAHLNEKYKTHDFSLIIGQDNLENFHKWKNYEEILNNYKLYVYPRQGYKSTKFESHKNVVITQAPVIDISSTFIRNAIKEKKDIRFFMPHKVWEYVDEMNFYKNKNL